VSIHEEQLMKKQNKSFAVGVGIGVVATFFVQFLLAVAIAITGGYDVAASRDHTPLVRWMLNTTMENAVKRMASDVGSPPQQPDLAKGGSEYKAMCEHCHGGPGVERAEWAEGILPMPPHLTEHAAEWQAGEIFWLVKHGVKATAMPSFGSSHDDETLWNIAAFVEQLPGMTKQDYAAVHTEHDHHH